MSLWPDAAVLSDMLQRSCADPQRGLMLLQSLPISTVRVLSLTLTLPRGLSWSSTTQIMSPGCIDFDSTELLLIELVVPLPNLGLSP